MGWHAVCMVKIGTNKQCQPASASCLCWCLEQAMLLCRVAGCGSGPRVAIAARGLCAQLCGRQCGLRVQLCVACVQLCVACVWLVCAAVFRPTATACVQWYYLVCTVVLVVLCRSRQGGRPVVELLLGKGGYGMQQLCHRLCALHAPACVCLVPLCLCMANRKASCLVSSCIILP